MKKNSQNSKQRVTIRDIAAMASVSIGTVDRVLHNRGEVNEATRERVMSFVEDLGYTPNLLAKSLALKKHFSIAALIPDAGRSNPYWEKPLSGIQRAISELNDYNCNISVYTFDAGSENSFIQNFKLILDEKPDGLIFTPHFYEASLSLIAQCEQQEIPYIFVDTNMEASSNLSYFGQNAFQSGYVAAKFMHYGLPLNSRVLIMKLAWNKAITPHMKRREEGFLSYFHESSGLPFQMRSLSIDLSDKNEPAFSLDPVFQSSMDVSGVFVTNSRVHSVARYLQENHKQRIFLVGYDLTEENLACLREGSIDMLICQKPEEQGYNSILAMFNYLLTRKPVVKVNFSPIDILVKENVDYFIKSNNS